MNKILSFIFAAGLALGFTACEDVPAPYNIVPVTPDGTDTTSVEAKGSGSVEDPYNCVKANQVGEALASGASTDTEVYIKGIVSSIKEAYTSNYGNASFYISDNGSSTNQFYVYRAYYLGNVKYADGQTNIQTGDTVVVCAKITNYMGNTVETVQNAGYLYSLNGKTVDGGDGGNTGEATGDGTESNPYNSVAANAYASSLAADVTSDKAIYVKGIVSSVKEQFSTNYGNASFYISEDGTTTNQFYVYRTLYLGNVKYTEGQTNIKVGDKVVVCGKVVNYKGNTPETVQGETYLVSLESSDVTPDPTPDPTPDTPAEVEGTTYSCASLGATNGVALETITLPDGTTLTFNGGGNSNTPKYYDNGACIRMYPKNSFVVNSSKKIEKIFLTCYTYNTDIYNASGELTVSAGNVSTSSNILAITGINSTSNTITVSPTATSGAASQLRFSAITIKYAE